MWQVKALELQNKGDAFFVVNHSTLKDELAQQLKKAIEGFKLGDQ